MGDDYGYFGSGSSGYAHYQQTFKSCFGGSSGSDGGHHNNEPDWSNLLTLLKIGVLIVVPLYWTVTALHIAFYDLASIEPITILIDLFGTLAFSSLRIKKQGEVKNFCRSHPAGPRRIGLAQSSGKSTLPTKE